MNTKSTVGFNKEINALIGKQVKVELRDSDNYYKATLVGYSIQTGAIAIEKAIDKNKQKFSKIIIKGDAWSMMFLEEALFPMEELRDRIAKVFPAGQVKYDPDSLTINILNGKIIISEAGVEGTGPTAARVSRIYDEFIESLN